MKQISKLITTMFILFISVFGIYAEIVVLKDGSVLNGKITNMGAEFISIKTDMGELSIPREKIKDFYLNEDDYLAHGGKALNSPKKDQVIVERVTERIIEKSDDKKETVRTSASGLKEGEKKRILNYIMFSTFGSFIVHTTPDEWWETLTERRQENKKVIELYENLKDDFHGIQQDDSSTYEKYVTKTKRDLGFNSACVVIGFLANFIFTPIAIYTGINAYYTSDVLSAFSSAATGIAAFSGLILVVAAFRDISVVYPIYKLVKKGANNLDKTVEVEYKGFDLAYNFDNKSAIVTMSFAF